MQSRERTRFSDHARTRLEALRGRRVGVVGLGREGGDLVRFLARWGADVVVSDAAAAEALGPALDALKGVPARYLLGNQRGSDLLDCTELFVSPGVPPTASVVAEPAAAGIPISSATRLFFELCPGPIVGVTGSSGKTTTASLIGAILRTSEVNGPGMPGPYVGGNIGAPMLGHLDMITPTTWCVLELSSFQLEDVTQSPAIGLILNITPDHLDRHPDPADYIRAKSNVIRFQDSGDIAALNADDPTLCTLPHASHTMAFSLAGEADGAWLAEEHLLVGGAIWTKRDDPGGPASNYWLPAQVLVSRSDVPLRGRHNVGNVLAAAATALAVGCWPRDIAAGVRGFHPVTHRLEVVATIDGVTFVNDSIATSPERSMAALRSFEEKVVLIAGGRDKHLPMDDWAHLMGERARAVVLVGEAAAKINSALASAGVEVPIARASKFAGVVALARGLAQPGDVVLLSPGCTSFDEFRDYEARGEAFRAAVQALGPESGR